jgi:nitrite reductase (NADH) small subunit
VHGHRIACPLHSWVIELETGEAVAPDRGVTACFHIKEDQGNVYLKV